MRVSTTEHWQVRQAWSLKTNVQLRGRSIDCKADLASADAGAIDLASEVLNCSGHGPTMLERQRRFCWNQFTVGGTTADSKLRLNYIKNDTAASTPQSQRKLVTGHGQLINEMEVTEMECSISI